MIDELSELRSYRAEAGPPSADDWRHARNALTQAIHGGRTEKRAPNRRHWRVTMAVATALVIGAMVLAATLRSGSTAGPPPAAAAVLTSLASVAATQPSEAKLTRGEYRYTRMESTDAEVFPGMNCTLLVPKDRQTWVGIDGAGLRREQEGRPVFLHSSVQARCAKVRRLVGWGGITRDARLAKGCPATAEPVDLRHLPTDPARLRAKLRTGKIEGGPEGDAEAFTQAGDLLRETNATPKQRAALYRAAAGLHGVQSLGPLKDHAGREGIGLAIIAHNQREVLIFNPNTSELMGEQETVANTKSQWGGPIGTVTGWQVYYPTRIVKSVPAASPTARTEWCGHEPMAPMAKSQ